MIRLFQNLRINRDSLGVVDYDLCTDFYYESGRSMSIDSARELWANGGCEWTLCAYAKMTVEVRDNPLVYVDEVLA